VGAVALLAAGYASELSLTDNFHVVVPARVFRSGQMSPAKLAREIREHKIASVLNLRGQNIGKRWYDGECVSSARLGVVHLDFEMSSSREVTDDEVRRLTELLRGAPKPLLIHCGGGSDRSGFVSALYLLRIENRPPAEAAKQLGIRYGHFPYLHRRRSAAMDRSFQRVVDQPHSQRLIDCDILLGILNRELKNLTVRADRREPRATGGLEHPWGFAAEMRS